METAAAEHEIRRLLGEQFFRPATAEDSIDGVAPRWVAEPASTAEVAGVLRLCDQAGLRVVARGGGTKIDWGNPPRAVDLILGTRRLNRVLEHAAGDMTATVQAGCAVAALGNALAERGQRLALDPLWPDRATVGGIIATHDSGALRVAYGTLRDHLIGITAVLADGTIARSGGKVVKNVAGYDLPKLFTGSFGTLGVITEATFRLYSIPRSSQTVRLIVPTTETLGRLIDAMMKLSLITLAVQFEIEVADPVGVSVLVGGVPEAMQGKLQRVIQAGRDCGTETTEPTADAWSARERLFSGVDVCVAQVSMLPTKWPGFVDRMRDLAASGGSRWSVVAQSVGVGTMRVAHAEPAQLAAGIKSIRAEVEKTSGSLVILRCSPAMKTRIDVWPDAGDALPLMRRVKEHFDPHGTLSPGRFVGGI